MAVSLHARTPRAFSLIEAIIAIVVLSVAVPAMFWAVRDAADRRTDPVMLNRARWLAAEKMEDVLADRANADRGYGYVVAANYPAESPVAGFAGLSREVMVAERGPDLVSAGTGYKVVTVRVTYTSARGAARTFELASVVTDY
jgi:Tfp pilus assembly protein PilV